jgi:hypothetical protein
MASRAAERGCRNADGSPGTGKSKSILANAGYSFAAVATRVARGGDDCFDGWEEFSSKLMASPGLSALLITAAHLRRLLGVGSVRMPGAMFPAHHGVFCLDALPLRGICRRSRNYFGGSDGLRKESNRSPLAGCFLKAHFS